MTDSKGEQKNKWKQYLEKEQWTLERKDSFRRDQDPPKGIDSAVQNYSKKYHYEWRERSDKSHSSIEDTKSEKNNEEHTTEQV